jgi:hypothetical protein
MAMFKQFINSSVITALALGLLFTTPLLAADPTGVFTGQAPDGPVVLQLHTGLQGYLNGQLQCNGRDFAVVASQNGNQLLGLVGAPGFQPVQLRASLRENGSIVLACNGSTIALQRNQAPTNPAMTNYAAQNDATSTAASTEQQAMQTAPANPLAPQPTATPADSVTADLSALADQASKERQAELAKLYAPQNPQPMYQTNPQQSDQYQTPNNSYSAQQPSIYQAANPQSAAGAYAPASAYQMPQTQYQPQNYPTAPAYNYPAAPYAPMPAASYNQPNDGSAVMQNYEQYQAAQDQLSLQRSDAMREQNRYTGPDGQEITAPENATQVTVDQAGQATYTTEQAPTPPADETVAQPYSYSAPAAPAAEGDGN